MSNRSKRYSLEFKHSLVELYQNEDRSMASLSREYGVTIASISKWVNDEKIIALDDDKPVNQKAFRKMQKDLADLQEENAILNILTLMVKT